ncbi:hypothetical protein HanRHA438_Chr05g0232721 [Helianthus annuus]|nr:hypothetical protein HanRHA438_Chr05g0232721 [Helianthus annuus]
MKKLSRSSILYLFYYLNLICECKYILLSQTFVVYLKISIYHCCNSLAHPCICILYI